MDVMEEHGKAFISSLREKFIVLSQKVLPFSSSILIQMEVSSNTKKLIVKKEHSELFQVSIDSLCYIKNRNEHL